MSRFYIPRRDSGMDIAKLGLQLYGLKQHGDISAAQQKLSERELALKGEQVALQTSAQRAELGDPGSPEAGIPPTPGWRQQGIDLQGRQVGLQEKQQKLAEDKAKQEKEANVDLDNFGTPKAVYTVGKLEKLGIPKNHPLLESIKSWGADPNVTNAEAYNRLINDYPAYRGQLAEVIMQDYMKKSEKDPLYAKSPDGMAQMQFVETLDSDPTGEKVIGQEFKGTIAAMQRRQAGATSAQASLASATKPQLFNLDQLMANQVATGKMSWETAFSLKQKAESSPEIMKLISAYNTATNPEDQKMIMARMNKLTETTGLSLRMDKEGNLELVQGPGVKGGAGTFGKTSANAAEKKLFDTTEGLSRLAAIDKMWTPEYQTVGTKFSMWGTASLEKLGIKPSAEDKKALEGYSKFRRRAYEHMNQYLNEISGAAITEQEAKRLQKALPNPGEGIFEGDSPTEFQAKMKDAMQSSRWAIARYNYAQNKGLGWKSISLENMPEIVNERAAQIEQQVRSQGVPEDQVIAAVKEKLALEFGVMGK